MKKITIEIIQITCYICMGLQIGLGFLWAVANWGKVPGFEESRELLFMAETLQPDDYTGLLYPVCIKGSHLLEGWTGLPSCGFVYGLQLVVAYFSYQYFLRWIVSPKPEKRMHLQKRMPVYVGFLITIPVVLQVHMAVLPYSLASSFFVVLLARVLQVCLAESAVKKKDFYGIVVFWILSAQFCPDYFWLSTVAVGIGAVWYIGKHKEAVRKWILLMVLMIACMVGLNSFWQTPGSTGKMERTFGGIMLTRFVWPNFNELSFFWDKEVKESFTVEELSVLSTYPEKVFTDFGPVIEQKYGKKRAGEIYWNMVKISLKMDTKDVLYPVIEDGAAYLCPPLSVYLQLRGMGTSYTGWNYGRMKDYTPLITKYYVEISLKLWIYLLIAGTLLLLLNIFSRVWCPAKEKARIRSIVGYCILNGLVVNGWYVMVSGNMQDYKKVLMITILWGFVIIAVLRRPLGRC